MLKPFSKEEIEDLCSDENLHQKCNRWKFWTSEVYGLGKSLREYAYFYPQKLPLFVYSSHGVFFKGEPSKHELESKAPIQLYNWDEHVKLFKKKSKKLCYQFEWPYVYYRKKHGFKKHDDAKGTIVFPAHVTQTVKNEFDIDKYIYQLKSLPEEFQPVSICLHKSDVEDGIHQTYLNAGFNVYTAGNYSDDRYLDRFYDLLSHFKYSTSNEIGSYVFFSVEMGIPFFFYGEKAKLINHGDDNFCVGEIDYFKDENYKKAVELFTYEIKNNSIEISQNQLEFVNDKLGINSGMTRLKMTLILWWGFIAYRLNPFRALTKFLK